MKENHDWLTLLLLAWALTATWRCSTHQTCPNAPSCPPCIHHSSFSSSSSSSSSFSSSFSSLAADVIVEVPERRRVPQWGALTTAAKRQHETVYDSLQGGAQCDPARDNPAERQALTALFLRTSTWFAKSRNDSSQSVCCWTPWYYGYGIGCDVKSGRVTQINLGGIGLVGSVDVSVFTELISLELPNNHVTAITGLDALIKLQNFDLSQNHLTAVPGLGALTQVTFVQLGMNHITSLPDLKALTRLDRLFLNTNQLVTVPGLHHLTKLEELYLYQNQLTAMPNLQALRNLTHLFLFENKLSSIPGLHALTQLQWLFLQHNQLQTLPGLQELNQLTWLALAYNDLTAVSELQALTHLQALYLHNNLISELPSNMSWAHLETLTLYNNRLTALPTEMASLPTKLNYVQLFRNHLSSLPTWLADMPSLRVLDASHNRLTSIPDFSAANLTSLLLLNNRLSLLAMAGRVHTVPLLDVSSNLLNASLGTIMSHLTQPATASSFAAANCSILHTVYDSDSAVYPHLVSLDVHANVAFEITSQNRKLTVWFPVLNSLDLSYTAWTSTIEYPQLRTLRAAGLPRVFWPTVIATSSSLQLLDGTETTWLISTSAPIDDVETNDAQLVRFPSYNALTCPSWRFKISKGLFLIDASFGDFRGCYCPDQHYFQRLVPWGCMPCPAHLSCNASSSRDALHNITGNLYPVVRVAGNYSGASLVQATAFLPCHFPICNMKATSVAGTFVCREGHDSSSLLCSKCEVGYFAGRGTCSKCYGAYVVLVPLLLLLAAVAFVWYVATRDPSTSGHLVSIVSFWLQLMALLQDSTQAVSSSSSLSSSNTVGFQSSGPQSFLQELASFRPWALECAFGNDYWDFFTSSWCLLWTPFVVPLVTKLSSALFAHYTSGGDDMWQYRTLYVWELLYVPVSSRVFALFHCVSEHNYLSSEPYISCSESRFVALRGFAIVVLIVYVLALPVVSLYGVAKGWAPFEFMKRSFHERTWWWQAVVWRVRALALVMFVQLLPYDSSFIPILVWMLLLASISLNLLYKPYRIVQDGWLMTALLAMSTVIYQTSIVAPSFDNNSGADVFVQVCYALCLVLVAVAAGWHRLLFKRQTEDQGSTPLEVFQEEGASVGYRELQ